MRIRDPIQHQEKRRSRETAQQFIEGGLAQAHRHLAMRHDALMVCARRKAVKRRLVRGLWLQTGRARFIEQLAQSPVVARRIKPQAVDALSAVL